MLIKRSFTIQGHRTSVALELDFWAAFDRAVTADAVTPTQWITALDE
ncbi:MAG: ribbon-helix-helix domain-containing protein, partial [Sandaracinobacteroides sp.]